MSPKLSMSAELEPLLALSSRVGNDPLLTQASTGNSSIKLNGVLWIKASGKWMADAHRSDILIPLDLAAVTECLEQSVDPADRFPSASIETSMHSVVPRRVVLHVHSVNTIAWAVREDAQVHLHRLLDGLRWRWVPYVPSGLPLAREIEKVLSPDLDVLILGNHGLVLAGDDCADVERLLDEVERRLAIPARRAHPADYDLLARVAANSEWELPDDDDVHALGTDAVARKILSVGLLFPCQAIFSSSSTPELFSAVRPSYPLDQWASRYEGRPFLIVEGCGVVFHQSMTPAECAMVSGLAQVVLRTGCSTPVRYLTEGEIESNSSQVAYRYRELANARR
jgi:rhamnose utilization protein RhaD (predicted bifunctional aldolase and dehydrogenase)